MNISNLVNVASAHTDEAGEFFNHHGPGMMMDGFGSFGLWWIFPIIFWALVIFGLVALIKYVFDNSKDKNGNTNKRTYICAECGYEYEEKEWAQKCQKWCAEHKSCNIEIIKHL